MQADNLNEILAVYNEKGEQLSPIDRLTAHSRKDILHGSVHIFVFNSEKKLLLQKRSMNKLTMPGRFDTSAGGHIAYGEDEVSAAIRELDEELAIRDGKIEFLYKYIWESPSEREYVFTFYTIYDGKIEFLKSEIDEVKFFDINDIDESLGIFTPNLIYELKLLKNTNFYIKHIRYLNSSDPFI